MANEVPDHPTELGQIVRRRRNGSSTAAWGLVVGLMLTDRIEALVRWRGERESTSELVDTLVDAIRFLL
jgi:hypothetical protein